MARKNGEGPAKKGTVDRLVEELMQVSNKQEKPKATETSPQTDGNPQSAKKSRIRHQLFSPRNNPVTNYDENGIPAVRPDTQTHSWEPEIKREPELSRKRSKKQAPPISSTPGTQDFVQVETDQTKMANVEQQPEPITKPPRVRPNLVPVDEGPFIQVETKPAELAPQEPEADITYPDFADAQAMMAREGAKEEVVQEPTVFRNNRGRPKNSGTVPASQGDTLLNLFKERYDDTHVENLNADTTQAETRGKLRELVAELTRKANEKRDNLIDAESELFGKDKDFYTKHGVLGRAAREMTGIGAEQKDRERLELRVDTAAAIYERSLENKLRVRLAQKNLSPEAEAKLATRYRRAVISRDIIDRGEKASESVRESVLGAKDRTFIERGFRELAERSALLDKRLGKTGGRIARVFLSASAGTLATVAFGPASVALMGSIWAARVARGVVGVFGGAAIGLGAGKIYEKTRGASAARKLAEARTTVARSSRDIADKRAAYKAGSSEAIARKRKYVEAVTAILSGAGLSGAIAELASGEVSPVPQTEPQPRTTPIQDTVKPLEQSPPPQQSARLDAPPTETNIQTLSDEAKEHLAKYGITESSTPEQIKEAMGRVNKDLADVRAEAGVRSDALENSRQRLAEARVAASAQPAAAEAAGEASVEQGQENGTEEPPRMPQHADFSIHEDDETISPHDVTPTDQTQTEDVLTVEEDSTTPPPVETQTEQPLPVEKVPEPQVIPKVDLTDAKSPIEVSHEVPAAPAEAPPATPDIVLNKFGIDTSTFKEPHIYGSPDGKEVYVYGSNNVERVKTMAEYFATNPKAVIVGADPSGVHRVQWGFSDGKVFYGEPMKSGFLRTFLKPPGIDDLKTIIK